MVTAVVVSLTLLSGLMTVLSLPAFDLGFLGWFAVAPFLVALRGRRPAAATGLGFTFGWVVGAGSFAWLTTLPAVTPGRFAALVTAFAVFYAVFALSYAAISRAVGPWMVLAAPILWVSLEYARGSLPIVALPWNFIAHSQYRYLAVIQVADLAGALGISFLLLMVNQLISQIPDVLSGRTRHWRVQTAVVALAIASTLGYGWYTLNDGRDGGRTVRVALVQANVMARRGMSVKEQMAHLAAYERLTRVATNDRPALVVWPSSSLPGPLSFWMIQLYVNDIAHRAGAHLLVGGAGGDKLTAPPDGRAAYSNSQFLISPSGRLEARYDKIRLTPFTEYVPLEGTVTWPGWVATARKSFVPGDRFTLFEVGQARFGTPICWENAFADLFRRFVLNGADFMVSVTNEGAFGDTSAPHQTLAMNVFRAVENRVAIARAATTGVSAFVDPKGAIIARVTDDGGKDVFVPGVLVWDVPLSTRTTFYTLFGDVFARGVVVAALLMLVVCAAVARRTASPSPQPQSLAPRGARTL